MCFLSPGGGRHASLHLGLLPGTGVDVLDSFDGDSPQASVPEYREKQPVDATGEHEKFQERATSATKTMFTLFIVVVLHAYIDRSGLVCSKTARPGCSTLTILCCRMHVCIPCLGAVVDLSRRGCSDAPGGVCGLE